MCHLARTDADFCMVFPETYKPHLNVIRAWIKIWNEEIALTVGDYLSACGINPDLCSLQDRPCGIYYMPADDSSCVLAEDCCVCACKKQQADGAKSQQ